MLQIDVIARNGRNERETERLPIGLDSQPVSSF
jgi:hypothetical protein